MLDADKPARAVLASYFATKFAYSRLHFWIDEKAYLTLCNGKCPKGNTARESVQKLLVPSLQASVNDLAQKTSCEFAFRGNIKLPGANRLDVQESSLNLTTGNFNSSKGTYLHRSRHLKGISRVV